MSETLPRGSAAIEASIASECRMYGSISFARFMDLALYAPENGYYESTAARMGTRADFVTAPEISALFGHCVARQLAQLMRQCELNSLVEVGPGSGQLATQVLAELARLDAVPARYVLVERSGALRAIQRKRLAEQLPEEVLLRIDWRCDLADLGEAVDGIVFANELLDALPAHRFKVESGALRELRVAERSSGGFAYVTGSFEDPIARAECDHLVNSVAPLSDGYQSELLTGQASWLLTVASSLRRGACLLFDYGYPRSEFYHPQRNMGTVRCYSRQRRHDDPLFAPGTQDISVHVDFTRLAEIGSAAGMRVSGFCDQAHFLMANGLLEALQATPASELGTAEHSAMVQQARMLMMPGELGEAVKCLLLTRGLDEAVTLNTARDQRHRL